MQQHINDNVDCQNRISDYFATPEYLEKLEALLNSEEMRVFMTRREYTQEETDEWDELEEWELLEDDDWHRTPEEIDDFLDYLWKKIYE